MDSQASMTFSKAIVRSPRGCGRVNVHGCSSVASNHPPLSYRSADGDGSPQRPQRRVDDYEDAEDDAGDDGAIEGDGATGDAGADADGGNDLTARVLSSYAPRLNVDHHDTSSQYESFTGWRCSG